MPSLAIFYAIQFVGISFFMALAAYVFFSRNRRPIQRPLVAFLIVEALQFASVALMNWPNEVNTAIDPVWIARLRIELGFLSLPLLLHMAVYLMEGRRRQQFLRLTQIGYILALVAMVATQTTHQIVTAVDIRGSLGAVPVISRLGYLVGASWEALSWAAAIGLLAYARRRLYSPRIRADLQRLTAVWLLLLFADVLGAVTPLLGEGLGGLAFMLGCLHYITGIAAVVVLGVGILRYGSPAGTPLRPNLSLPALVASAALLALDVVPMLQSSPVVNSTMLLLAPLAGLSFGLAFSRIDFDQAPASWSADLLLPSLGSFTRNLGTAWEELALGGISNGTLERLRQALKNEIGASFLAVMDVLEGEEPGVVTYSDSSRFSTLALNDPSSQSWPITSISHPAVAEHTLPAPFGIVLPIVADEPEFGLLVVGERNTGGVYGSGDLEKVRRLVHLLEVASRARRQPGFDGRLRPSPAAVSLAEPCEGHPEGVMIRTLGRLEVEGGDDHPLPLRARQVLEHLLLAYPRPVSSESLMGRIWPDRTSHAAANNLYVAVHALRRALEPNLSHGQDSHYILREGEYYRLVGEGQLHIDWWDLEKGYRWATSKEAWSDPDDIQQLMQVLKLYRGRFLDDPSLEPPAESEAARYRLERMFAELMDIALRESAAVEDWASAEEALLHALQVEPHDRRWHHLLEKMRQANAHVAPKTPHSFDP